MSKKKSDPEEWKSLEDVRNLVDYEKVASSYNSVLIQDPLTAKYWQLYYQNVDTKGYLRTLISIDEKLKDQEGHSLNVFVRYLSIQNPKYKLHPIYIQTLQKLHKRYPIEKVNALFTQEQKALTEKNFKDPANKYLVNIKEIEWLKLHRSLENHFFIIAIWESLNQESPKIFRKLKESIMDLPNEIANHLEIKEKDISDLNNLHSTTTKGVNIKVLKTKRGWKAIKKMSKAFKKALKNGKEIGLKDSATQEEFDKILPGLLDFFEIVKTQGVSLESFPNVLNYIHTVDGSNPAKYLFLHKLFLILYPSQFTSISEWEASRKSNPFTKNGYLGKTSREDFIDEVEKFLKQH